MMSTMSPDTATVSISRVTVQGHDDCMIVSLKFNSYGNSFNRARMVEWASENILPMI